MKANLKVIDRQYPVVAFFVRHLAFSRGLQTALNDLTDHQEFWGSTASAHLGLAVVEWCKVFGSDGEEAHWKKALVDPDKQDLDEFRRRISIKTGLDLSSCP